MRKYRILVVDDRKVAADILATLLRKKGQEVHTAYGGEEAIVAAERLRPDVRPARHWDAEDERL